MILTWIQTLYGLVAAGTWGAADYCGGIAAKRTNAYSVVITAHSASMFILIIAALYFREPFPLLIELLWGCAAGLGGGLGLLLLYKALADGSMAVAAPVSALVAAAIPVVFAVFKEAFPGIFIQLGFLMALCSIWMISSTGKGIFRFSDLIMPSTAGLAFGIFFLCLHQASNTSVIIPLIVVRIVSIISVLIYALMLKQSIRPAKNSLFPIILSGFLDTIGTGSFAFATHLGRVDVAAVLGSLYPASTVLLAWILLKEKISRLQMIGIAFALIAIVFITI